MLENLQHRLHPCSSYVVIPVFALANAGVSLDRKALADALGSRLMWAVLLGLVAGKLFGIAGATGLSAGSGLGRFPDGVGFRHIVGAGGVAGIGFTVSLFITGLAFTDDALQTQAKTGILAGSLVAALVGAAVLQPSNDAGLTPRFSSREDH